MVSSLLGVCLVDHCVTGKWKFKTKPGSWFPFAPVVRNLERNNNSHIYLTEVGVSLVFFFVLWKASSSEFLVLYRQNIKDILFSVKGGWKSYYPFLSRANTFSWASFSRSGGVHSSYTNRHPHLCVFYRAVLIDCNIFYCHSTACSKVAFPERLGASGIGV